MQYSGMKFLKTCLFYFLWLLKNAPLFLLINTFK